jgi:hypothetical protein
MSINKYKPHLLVLPEDDATRQIANGFIFAQGLGLDNRVIQILPYVGGWKKVLEDFIGSHFYEMHKYPDRMMVLLIDFDNNPETRLLFIKKMIPTDIQARVFVLGVWSEPENLRSALGSAGFEKIGVDLAQDCYDNTNNLWGHELLKHNEAELRRMILSVKPFLFA